LTKAKGSEIVWVYS